MGETELILVRHGETAWNRERRMQGHVDTVLSQAGREQAAALAERLARMRFAALYTSDLRRARDTAGAIAARTGHAVLCDPRLRERAFGLFEGLTVEEIRARYPLEFERFSARDPDFTVPGGESARAFRRRTLECLEEIARRHAGATVVVVTHGLVLDAVYRLACGLPHDVPRGVPLLNGSLNRFAWDGQRWRLEAWGDVAHLEPALGGS
jgi:probable phosphoglycerate mutase